MRRLIALTTTALALTLAPFSAARAQGPDPTAEDDLVVTVSQPAAGNYSGVIDVRATITDSHPVDSIRSYTVELLTATGAGQGTFCSVTFPEPQVGGPDPRDSVPINFKWNTERLPTALGDCTNGSTHSGATPSTNNKYRIRVTATTFGRPDASFADTDNPSTGELAVSNAPYAPVGVKLGYDKGAKTINVSWAKNGDQPDVGDYRVQECIVDRSSKPCGGGDWKTVKDGWGQTSIVFKTVGPGIYRYRVAALRPTAQGQTMVSEWASAQGEPTEIEVKNDPPPAAAPPGQAAPAPSGGESPQQPPEVQTRTVVQPTRRVARAAPQVVQRIVEEEPGYNTELPYEGQASSGGLPLDGAGEGEGQRAMLIPVAGGLAVLMFALQMQYLNRRAHAALETVPLDGEEWDRD